MHHNLNFEFKHFEFPKFPLKGGRGLLEYEINCQDEADKCCEVVPMEMLSLEENVGDDAKDYQRDDFLNNLQLH